MTQAEIDALAGIVRTGLARDDRSGREALDSLLSLIEPDRDNPLDGLRPEELLAVAETQTGVTSAMTGDDNRVTLWPWMSR